MRPLNNGKRPESEISSTGLIREHPKLLKKIVFVFFSFIALYHSNPITMSVQRFVTLVQEEVEKSRISNINSGGCGIFALYVSLHMKALNLPYEIIALSTDTDPETWNKSKEEFVNKVVNNNNSKKANYHGLSCSHVAVLFDDKNLFDSNKLLTISENEKSVFCANSWTNYLIVGSYEIEVLKAAVKPQDGWNESYDRRQNTKLFSSIRKAYHRYLAA